MHDCKPMDTPIENNLSLSLDMCPKTPNEKEQMSKVPYTSTVGSLMYSMICTRPDICYAIGLVRKFQSNPGLNHWKRILRYLKGTSYCVLCYQGKDLRLVRYTDVDWKGDLDQCKLTSGYAFLLNDCAISWSSKKKSCIALSIMEVEYVVCSSVIQEAVWLRVFLQHLEIVKIAFEPVKIYYDSMVMLAYAQVPKYHGKTKHIQIIYHFFKDMITLNEVVMRHIPTSKMVANPFTKPIARDAFVKHSKSLGLCRIRLICTC